MTIVEIDKIVAAYERTASVRSVAPSQRIQATAQALGICESLVREALERAEEVA